MMEYKNGKEEEKQGSWSKKKRMKRSQRLQSAMVWMEKYEGGKQTFVKVLGTDPGRVDVFSV